MSWAVTVMEAGAELQPFVVPVTVYVPVAFTVVAAVVAPLLQLYVSAPEAVNVILPPGQNVVPPFVAIETVGVVLTVTAIVFDVLLQPLFVIFTE